MNCYRNQDEIVIVIWRDHLIMDIWFRIWYHVKWHLINTKCCIWFLRTVQDQCVRWDGTTVEKLRRSSPRVWPIPDPTFQNSKKTKSEPQNVGPSFMLCTCKILIFISVLNVCRSHSAITVIKIAFCLFNHSFNIGHFRQISHDLRNS